MVSEPFEIVLLGTGAAFPPLDRENTSLAFIWEGGIWLVDCSASPHRRLRMAGLDPRDLRGIVVTHHHPDHLYGLPSLVHCLIPTPRSEPLTVLAPAKALRCARRVLEAFDLLQRPEVPLSLFEIPAVDSPGRGLQQVAEVDGLKLFTAPVEHTLECVGVHAEAGGRTAAYSADTAPCEGVSNLARASHLLIHEATFTESERAGMPPGHSTALDAGRAAAEAGVEKLLLVHFLEETISDPAALKAEAARAFDGQIEIGEELGRYTV
jgi:ribonuclease Z